MTIRPTFIPRSAGATASSAEPQYAPARLLYAVAAVLLAIVAVLGLIANQQSRALSQARAYTTGEGLYSKAQKSAVISLLRYARTGAEADYRQFQREIEVPLGDRDARIALQRRPIDRRAAEDGFLRGRNHRDDIDGMIDFFDRFESVSYVGAAIAIWEQGDAEVERLRELGEQLHRAVARGAARDSVDALLVRIVETDDRLTRLEDSFSATLGDGARFLVTLSNVLVAAIAVVLVTLGLAFASRMARSQRRAEKALRLSEARYRSLTERMLDGVLILQNGRFAHANPAALQLVGYTLEELRGKEFAPLIHEPFRALVAERHRRRLGGETLDERYEIQVVARDGTIKWVALSNVLLGDWGDEPAVLTIISDVTEVHAARETLDTHRAQLENLVEKRTVELIAARERAEAASKAKSDFLANVSHEIRTPLNAVLGLGRIGARDTAGDAAAATFTEIVAAGEHLLGVIDDILDVAKIEAGKLPIHREPFRLAATLEDARSIVAVAAADKGLVLSVASAPGLPQWVNGDARRLQQILVNLLSNAIKFTEQGEVALGVEPFGDAVRFAVTDTGVGLTDAQMRRLFTPFEQGDSSLTRRHGGNGLGLAISRSLARLMGGDIDVTSTYGEGSCFTLQLPLPAARPESAAPPPAAPLHSDRLAGLNVLVAEDVAVNRLILGDLLERHGASVVFAENGEQALEHVLDAQQPAFDVVLMDVQMPLMDGYEATQRIRAIVPTVPVIGQTAHALPEDHRRCLAAGMVAVVVKPIEPEVLIQAILEAVGRHAPSRALHPARPAELTRDESAQPVQVERSSLRTETPFAGPSEWIDWAALEARYPQPGFVEKVARMTLATHATTPAKLREKAQCGEVEAVRFLAHTVKGLGGNLESRRVHELAKQTEAAARSERDETFERATRLADAMDALLAEIADRYPPADTLMRGADTVGAA